MGSVELHMHKHGSALQVWPESPRSGEALHLSFVDLTAIGDRANQYDISLHDGDRRRVATIVRREMVPVGGAIFATWDGRLDSRGPAPAGRYLLRVARPGSEVVLERTIYIVS